MRNADGTPASVEKASATAVRWTYKQPNTLLLTALANQDGGDRTYAVFLPAHYLKRFHPTYTKKEELDKLVAAAGFKTWTELFAARTAPPENPQRPPMAARAPATRVSDQVFTLKRNPYFVGVDPSGNQLPYLDEVRFTFFADIQALNLAAIAGEFDMQERHIQMTNYPVFKENEKTGKYRVITWPTFGGADAVIQFNQTYKADADLGKLMATKEFRVALSEAINRDQIKESVFLGLGEARQGVPSPGHPYFPGDQYAKKYTQYKPEEANQLLDQVGLTKRDADGTRLLPSGKRVVLELSVVPAFAAWPDVAQLVAKDWEKVGVKTVVQLRERALHFKMRDNNELMSEIWNEDTTGCPFTGNAKFDPRNSPILTLGPLYGRWAQTRGVEGVEPPAPVKRIMEIVDQAKTVAPEQQAKLAQELFRIWVDNLWEVGTIGLTPMVQGVVVTNAKFRNVPTALGNDWPLRSPGNARAEQFLFTRYRRLNPPSESPGAWPEDRRRPSRRCRARPSARRRRPPPPRPRRDRAGSARARALRSSASRSRATRARSPRRAAREPPRRRGRGSRGPAASARARARSRRRPTRIVPHALRAAGASALSPRGRIRRSR